MPGMPTGVQARPGAHCLTVYASLFAASEKARNTAPPIVGCGARLMGSIGWLVSPAGVPPRHDHQTPVKARTVTTPDEDALVDWPTSAITSCCETGCTAKEIPAAGTVETLVMPTMVHDAPVKVDTVAL